MRLIFISTSSIITVPLFEPTSKQTVLSPALNTTPVCSTRQCDPVAFLEVMMESLRLRVRCASGESISNSREKPALKSSVRFWQTLDELELSRRTLSLEALVMMNVELMSSPLNQEPS